MLAAHDGPETGEDGPTHHGLFWMSLFTAYPGIKVYKPLDANEAVEMLFHAAQRGEPVVFSAVRPGTPVLKRGNGVPPAREAVNGAYVFKPFRDNGKPQNGAGGLRRPGDGERARDPAGDRRSSVDVKIVAVTSPQLYEELRRDDPEKADAILADDERQYVIDAAQRLARASCIRSCCPPTTRARLRHGPLLALRQARTKSTSDAGFDAAGLAKDPARRSANSRSTAGIWPQRLPRR